MPNGHFFIVDFFSLAKPRSATLVMEFSILALSLLSPLPLSLAKKRGCVWVSDVVSVPSPSSLSETTIGVEVG
ncbi:hypothetical protein C5167_026105 [Papaver somniferum]|nr:hypothetical protein C5167_026105 [Papaver somniferum]